MLGKTIFADLGDPVRMQKLPSETGKVDRVYSEVIRWNYVRSTVNAAPSGVSSPFPAAGTWHARFRTQPAMV